jgi:hypothetical protein
MHQLTAHMSFFDIIGSVAYAFTSLPIPKDYFIQGSSGSDASCTAQGFFIQVGTVAAYTNVSLAVFYLLQIKYGWSETRLKKVRPWLFACPIVVGMAFAFAGKQHQLTLLPQSFSRHSHLVSTFLAS